MKNPPAPVVFALVTSLIVVLAWMIVVQHSARAHSPSQIVITSPHSRLASTAALTVAIGTDIDQLDPALTTDGLSLLVASQLYDTLIVYQPGCSVPAPGLAGSWTVSSDGKTWTFNLRPGMKFHDNTPLEPQLWHSTSIAGGIRLIPLTMAALTGSSGASAASRAMLAARSQAWLRSTRRSDRFETIKANRPGGIFKTFVFAHETIANPNVIGHGASAIEFGKQAVKSAIERIKNGIKIFWKHDKSNDNTRPHVGEVVASGHRITDDGLQALAVAWFPPESKEFGIQANAVSMEAIWNVVKDSTGRMIAESVDAIKGLAVFDTRDGIRPGFSGAFELASIQAYNENETKEEKKMPDDNRREDGDFAEFSGRKLGSNLH